MLEWTSGKSVNRSQEFVHGLPDSIIHRWFYRKNYQVFSNDLKQFVGPLWRRFTHPLDILAVASDVKIMEKIIKKS